MVRSRSCERMLFGKIGRRGRFSGSEPAGGQRRWVDVQAGRKGFPSVMSKGHGGDRRSGKRPACMSPSEEAPCLLFRAMETGNDRDKRLDHDLVEVPEKIDMERARGTCRHPSANDSCI